VSSERRVKGSDLAYVNEHGLDGLEGFVTRVYASALELLRRSPSEGC
jgi:hypothetical protein